MTHQHGPGHPHGHDAPPASYDRAFAIGTVLNLAFVVVEFAFGIMAGSLALIADAGHNLSDVLSLLIGWSGHWLSRRAPTPQRTYGYRRGSILASLVNAVILYIAVGGIAIEGLQRLWTPAPVETGIVIWVALAGVVINTLTALLFMSGRQRDLNINGIFLHMAADAGISAGVVAGGVAIALTGWTWIDPMLSLAIAAIIALGTWSLLRDSLNLALDSVPFGIDRAVLVERLATIPGVVDVHHVHVWAMSTTEAALTAHLVRAAGADTNELIARASDLLKTEFGIDHSTLQVEDGSCAQDRASAEPR